jgi:hypothetical protein
VSHVFMQQTKPGQPMFKDRAALEEACTMLGLEVVDTNRYRWWGESVGDTPLPARMQGQPGENADFVVRMTEETKAELNCPKAYEVGMVADPDNPGCWTPVYDYFLGGYGLDKVIGEPVRKGGEVVAVCPRLKQYYDMVCDAHAAAEAGDSVEFLTLKNAHVLHPDLFQPSEDETTWVSLVNTEQRLGV